MNDTEMAEVVVREAARQDLASFIATVHQTDDGRRAIPPRHLEEIVIPALMDDSLGHTVIIAPPGSAKTMTVIGACEWWFGRDPTLHLAYVCNDEGAAVERSLVIKSVIEESDNYHAIFPGTRPDKQKGWSQTEWYLQRPVLTDKNPSGIFVGPGGGIIGNRLDRAVIDDIADVENMKTDWQRKSLITYLEQQLLTRFIGSKIGRAVMITTRWHEEDPAAWAIAQGWHVVHIPALNDQGESYWPEERPASSIRCHNDMHNPDKVCCMWKSLGGEKPWQLVMQGIVISDETALFKRTNWRDYNIRPAVTRSGIFVDLAHTEKTYNDETAILVASTDGVGRYLEHLEHGHWEYPEAEALILSLRERFPYPIYIEDNAGSKALQQRLSRQTWGVIPWKGGGRSKWARAEASAPSHVAGNWFLPQYAPWRGYLIEQCVAFNPASSKDDCVDVVTMMELEFQMRGARKPGGKPLKPYKKAWQTLEKPHGRYALR